LEENQVRAGFLEKGKQTAEVDPAVGIEREEGEDGGCSLPIISIVSRYQN
jgi:hypothetical protein